MPLWLIHLLAAATALALAEHWLRYALVERKRHRRAAARLERTRRGRELREDAIQPARHGVRGAMLGCTCIECKPWLRRYEEQMRAMQGVGGLGAQEAQHMARGLNPAGQTVQYRCQYCRRIDHHAETCQFFGALNTGTGPFP